MPKTKIIPTKDEQALAKTIVSETPGASVTFGRINGKTVLHVSVLHSKTRQADSVTVSNLAEWAASLLHPRFTKTTDDEPELLDATANRDAQ